MPLHGSLAALGWAVGGVECLQGQMVETYLAPSRTFFLGNQGEIKMATGHGGRRPGAGRKPKQPDVVAALVGEPSAVPTATDPLDFLEQVMRGSIDPSPAQLKAAIAAAKYRHRPPGDAGKKEEAAKRAEEASGGRFGARPPPLKRVA